MPRTIAHDFYVICDNLRSLHNVGSIFRTGDAFGVTKIFLCGITGRPGQSGLDKVALGAQHSVPWKYCARAGSLVARLKRQGVKIIALEQASGSQDLAAFKPQFPLALIVGNEVEGVSPGLLKRVDGSVQIPMLGQKESLNVSVAFGIAAYQLSKFKKQFRAVV